MNEAKRRGAAERTWALGCAVLAAIAGVVVCFVDSELGGATALVELPVSGV